MQGHEFCITEQEFSDIWPISSQKLMEHFKDFTCVSDQPLEQAVQRGVEFLSLGKSKNPLDTILRHVLCFDPV